MPHAHFFHVAPPIAFYCLRRSAPSSPNLEPARPPRAASLALFARDERVFFARESACLSVFRQRRKLCFVNCSLSTGTLSTTCSHQIPPSAAQQHLASPTASLLIASQPPSNARPQHSAGGGCWDALLAPPAFCAVAAGPESQPRTMRSVRSPAVGASGPPVLLAALLACLIGASGALQNAQHCCRTGERPGALS